MARSVDDFHGAAGAPLPIGVLPDEEDAAKGRPSGQATAVRGTA